MPAHAALAVALLLAGCGLRSAGRRLPDGGFVGTADGCNKRFDDGNRVLEPAGAPFTNVNALQFGKQGRLYVLNRASDTSYVSEFGPSPDHDFSRVIGRGVLRDAVDFAVDPTGGFWVLQDRGGVGVRPEAVKLDPDGAPLQRLALTVDQVGGLALARDGTLFVSYHQLAQLSSDGGVLRVFGAKPPWVAHYQGLAIDGAGFLWSTDPIERTVERFDSAGGRTARFGGHGPELGKFDGTSQVHGGPTDLAFDARGDLYVNDPLGSRIMKFDRVGTPLREFKFGGAENVEPIAVDPSTGNVYVGRDNGVDIICPL